MLVPAADRRVVLRPAQVAGAADGEGRRVQREGVERQGDAALLGPGAGDRVGGAGLQDVRADLPDVVGGAYREVDVPLAVDEVDLRRPDVGAHLTAGVLGPDGGLRGRGEALEGGGPAHHDLVVRRDGGREVVVAVGVLEDVRVGALLGYRVGEGDGGGRGGGGLGRGGHRGEHRERGGCGHQGPSDESSHVGAALRDQAVVGTRRHCWQLLLSQDHWRTSVPLAVPQSATSRTLPEEALAIRT